MTFWLNDSLLDTAEMLSISGRYPGDLSTEIQLSFLGALLIKSPHPRLPEKSRLMERFPDPALYPSHAPAAVL